MGGGGGGGFGGWGGGGGKAGGGGDHPRAKLERERGRVGGAAGWTVELLTGVKCGEGAAAAFAAARGQSPHRRDAQGAADGTANGGGGGSGGEKRPTKQ